MKTALIPRTESLLHRWRRLVGASRRATYQEPGRRLAALGYQTTGPNYGHLVRIERVVLVVLYQSPLGCGRSFLRLAGYRGGRVPWGAAWGGVERNVLLKDVSCRPSASGRGRRLGRHSDLLSLALALFSGIKRRQKFPNLPLHSQPQLPPLWAAFKPAMVRRLVGGGPELEALAVALSEPPDVLLRETRRIHRDLQLYPLDWVSHEWRNAVAIFADLERFPKRQVFEIADLATSLIGHLGATEFDFYHDRFSGPAEFSRRPRRRGSCLAVAG